MATSLEDIQKYLQVNLPRKHAKLQMPSRQQEWIMKAAVEEPGGVVISLPGLHGMYLGDQPRQDFQLLARHVILGAAIVGPELMERVQKGIRNGGMFYIRTGFDIGGNAVANGNGVDLLNFAQASASAIAKLCRLTKAKLPRSLEEQSEIDALTPPAHWNLRLEDTMLEGDDNLPASIMATLWNAGAQYDGVPIEALDFKYDEGRMQCY